MGSHGGPGYQNFLRVESPRPIAYPYEAFRPVNTLATPQDDFNGHYILDLVHSNSKPVTHAAVEHPPKPATP